MARLKDKRRKRRKLADKRKLARQTKSTPGKITNYIQRESKSQLQPNPIVQYNLSLFREPAKMKFVKWLNPKNKRHQQYIFFAVTRVTTKELFDKGFLHKQMFRIWAHKIMEKFELIDDKIRGLVKSAYWPESETERDKLSKLNDILGSVKFNPNRPYYKPHYKWLEHFKIIMGNYPNAAFLFENLDRAIRSDDYTKENKDAKLTESEILEFALAVFPYPVFLLCPVDVTAHKMTEYYKLFNEGYELSEFFERYKLSHKMQGWKKIRKKLFYSDIIYLKFVEEKSYGKISKMFDIPKRTIGEWCQEIKDLLAEYEK